LKDGSEAGENNSSAVSTNGHADSSPTAIGFNRDRPFSAPLVETVKLNKNGSAKDVRHVVIDLAGSGLKYQVGDALGVFPVNCSELAAEIVERLGAEPSTRVHTPSGSE